MNGATYGESSPSAQLDVHGLGNIGQRGCGRVYPTRFAGINTENPNCKVKQRWKRLVSSTFVPISVTSGLKPHASPAEMAGLRTSRSVRFKNSGPRQKGSGVSRS